MTDQEIRIRAAFEELRRKTSPNVLTELVYKTVSEEDKPDWIDYSILVGYVNIASQFSISIPREGERALKCRIVDSLQSMINLLEDEIEKLTC